MSGGRPWVPGVSLGVALVVMTGGLALPAHAGAAERRAIEFQQIDSEDLAWSGWASNVADYNEDGVLDVVLIERGRLGRFAGNGDGTLTRVGRPPARGTLEWPKDMVVADLNGDADPDLIRTTWRRDQVRVKLGRPGFRFGPASPLKVKTAVSPIAADLDADGDLDVAAKTGVGSAIVMFENDGAGSLSPAGRILLEVKIATSENLAAADVDDDGLVDFVSGDGEDGTFVVRNRGGWTFDQLESQKLGRLQGAFLLVDLDADGHVDLAATWLKKAYGDEGVAVALGRGDGTFRPSSFYVLGRRTTASLSAADVDNDGRLDLIGENYGVQVLRQASAGTFEPPVEVDGGSALSIAVADLDGDALPDLMVTDERDSQAQRLRVLRNVSELIN